MIDLIVKTTQYQNVGLPKIGIASYLVIEDRNKNQCYFIGAAGSTINMIRAISKQEGLSPYGIEFLELQTHTGYRNKAPGAFELKKITIKQEAWFAQIIKKIVRYDAGI